MNATLEAYEENVAAAKREVAVAEALAQDYRSKATMAQDEAGAANRRLDDARFSLEEAVRKQYESLHGQPVSFDDRIEFEKRWDARIEEIKAERARARLEAVSEGVDIPFEGTVTP